MTFPFTLPDWAPWWASLIVIVPAILLILAFLFMPFSVFGVKGRLEGVEARLDEIQAEIRSLSMRLPERLERYERDPRAIERYERDPVKIERYERDPVKTARYDRDPSPTTRYERDPGTRPRYDRDAPPPSPLARHDSEPDVGNDPDATDYTSGSNAIGRPRAVDPAPRRWSAEDRPPIPPAPTMPDRPPPPPSRRVDPGRGRTQPRIEPR